MQTKRIVALLVFGIAMFLLGGKLRPRSMITYRVGNSTFAFAPNEPLAGLESLRQSYVLHMVRTGKSNEAVAKLETILDLAIDGARHRRPLLDAGGRKSLDRVLTEVAKYRLRFPREKIPKPSGNDRDIEVWHRQVVEENSKFEGEIDTFLSVFAKEP